MPSPVGHSLAGLAVAGALGTTGPAALVAALVAANLPDIDYLIAGRHGGRSHSLGASVLCGAASGLALLPAGWSLGMGFALGAAACASHVLLDYLGKTPEDAERGGIPVFWPVSRQHYASPRHVFRTIVARRGSGSILTRLVNRSNARAIVREGAILGPVVLVAWLIGG